MSLLVLIAAVCLFIPVSPKYSWLFVKPPRVDDLECGISPHKPPMHGTDVLKIISGQTVTDPTQFPWMVKIQQPNFAPTIPYNICTGTIVSRRYILTSGMCLFLYYQPMGYGYFHWPVVNSTDFKIVAGTVQANDSEAVEIQSKRLIPHPRAGLVPVLFPYGFRKPLFRFSAVQDIALIELSAPLNFTNKIRPICLPADDTQFFDRTAVMAGWGQTKPHRLAPMAKKLQAGETFVFGEERKVCSNYTLFAPQQQLCTGNSGNGTASRPCMGDLGGPIMSTKPVVIGNRSPTPRWHQMGIVSMSNANKGHCGLPDIQTRVSHYCEWIAEASNGDVKCV